jgi:hypothetical protein
MATAGFVAAGSGAAVAFVAAGFAAAVVFDAAGFAAAVVFDAFETAGFAAAVGRADALAAVTLRVPAERVAAFAAAADRAPVTARTVAALAVAAFADATLTVAALARVAIVPAAAAATLPPTVRRGREAGAAMSVVVWVDPVRCCFPCRCAGTMLVAFSSTGFRDVPRAVVRVEPVPLTGSDPSTGRWSWWSELMHLTSVGGDCRGAPGERNGTYVNTS